MAEYTELEKKYLEEANIDSGMLYREIKKVNERLDNLDNKIQPKTDAEKRADILAIKDTVKRQDAIQENIHLFKGMIAGGKFKE